MRGILVLSVSLLLESCSVYQQVRSADFKDRMTYLRLGMEEEQVRELLGKPTKKLQRGEKEILIYEINPVVNEGEKRFVSIIFIDDRVVDYQTIQSLDLITDNP